MRPPTAPQAYLQQNRNPSASLKERVQIKGSEFSLCAWVKVRVQCVFVRTSEGLCVKKSDKLHVQGKAASDTRLSAEITFIDLGPRHHVIQ